MAPARQASSSQSTSLIRHGRVAIVIAHRGSSLSLAGPVHSGEAGQATVDGSSTGRRLVQGHRAQAGQTRATGPALARVQRYRDRYSLKYLSRNRMGEPGRVQPVQSSVSLDSTAAESFASLSGHPQCASPLDFF
ncbi:hypothetical protein CCHR01_08860 [Colletotrichum chrysophilum]|uniref:Uncharacterized protein n=1 Tax=Colletotrichum chrysophilum TaxID=1836956 RepID=A0AAD9AI33_9PEZI|nr:hypothetical protein CCHR01_08860 [Colletotrichum chrysophilum]